jgi:chitinase
VTVAVSPTTATLAAGASRTFTCSITGSTDTACTWSVQEGASGGTVTTGGVYTASQAAGTYHVVAKSHADATKSASAAVTVTAPPQGSPYLSRRPRPRWTPARRSRFMHL